MAKISEPGLLIFLLQISLLFILAKLAGNFFKKINQPPVIGELLSGLILGPTILGNLFPSTFNWLFINSTQSDLALDGFVYMALILLLFIVGLEVNLKTIAKEKKVVFWNSLMGLVIPLVCGFSSGWLMYDLLDLKISRPIFSIFFGVALSISALPVIAKIMIDLDLLKTRIGSIILATTTVNDVVGWIFFTVLLSIAGSGHGETKNIPFLIFSTIGFIAFSLLLLPKLIRTLFTKFDKLQKLDNSLVLGVAVAFLCALATEYIGIHAVFGAFLAGVAIGDVKLFSTEAKETFNQFI